MNNDYECSRLRVGVIGVFVKRKFYCATRPLEVNSSLLKKTRIGLLGDFTGNVLLKSPFLTMPR